MRRKKHEKIHESLEAVYIYIVGFNKIVLCKYSKEAMCFSDI